MEPAYQPRGTMPQAPQPPGMPNQGGRSSQKYIWIAVAVIVILAAAYFWYAGVFPLSETGSPSESAGIAADNVRAIEADLNTTDLNSLGADLSSLEAELAQ